MKKQYSAPSAEALYLHSETSMLAGSKGAIVNKGSDEVTTGASLSNEHAWSDVDWANSIEE